MSRPTTAAAGIAKAFTPLIHFALRTQSGARSGKRCFYCIPLTRHGTAEAIARLALHLKHQSYINWKLALGSHDPESSITLQALAAKDRRIQFFRTSPSPETDNGLFPIENEPGQQTTDLVLDPLGVARALPADALLCFVDPEEFLCHWWIETCILAAEVDPGEGIINRANLRSINRDYRSRQLASALLTAHPAKTVFAFTPQHVPTLIQGIESATKYQQPAGTEYSTQVIHGPDARWVIDRPSRFKLDAPVVSIMGWCMANDLNPPRKLIWRVPGNRTIVMAPNIARADVTRALGAPLHARMCGFRFTTELVVAHGEILLDAELLDGRMVNLGKVPYSVSTLPVNWTGAWLELGKPSELPLVNPAEQLGPSISATYEQLAACSFDPTNLPLENLCEALDTLFEQCGGDWVVVADSRHALFEPEALQASVTIAPDEAICSAVHLFGPHREALLAVETLPPAESPDLRKCAREFDALPIAAPLAEVCAIRVGAWRSVGGFKQSGGTSWPKILANFAERLARLHWKFTAIPRWLLVRNDTRERILSVTSNYVIDQTAVMAWRLALWNHWQKPRIRKGSILILTHQRGGGTTRHVHELALRIEEEGNCALLAKPVSASPSEMQLWSPLLGEEATARKVPINEDSLRGLLVECAVRHVHLHHTLGWPEPLLAKLPSILADHGVTYDVTLHDYAFYCPRINLMAASLRYCGEPAEDSCHSCIQQNGSDYGKVELRPWRALHESLLRSARHRFVPNPDTRTRMCGRFQDLSFECRPHWEPDAAPATRLHPRVPGEPLRIVILGAVSPAKGSFVLHALALDATLRSLPIHYTVLGITDSEAARLLDKAKNVTVTGMYREDEVYDQLNLLAPHLALFPAVWPETYSYTLSTAFHARLYPVAFDIGAPAQRIRAANWGSVLPMALADQPAKLNDLLLSLEVPPAPTGMAIGDAKYTSIVQEYYRLNPADITVTTQHD